MTLLQSDRTGATGRIWSAPPKLSRGAGESQAGGFEGSDQVLNGGVLLGIEHLGTPSSISDQTGRFEHREVFGHRGDIVPDHFGQVGDTTWFPSELVEDE